MSRRQRNRELCAIRHIEVAEQRQSERWAAMAKDIPKVVAWLEKAQRAVSEATQEWMGVVTRMAEHPEVRLLTRRYHNPWQWQCWWRL